MEIHIMSEQQDSNGKGLLQGLKKILFQDATTGNSQSTQPATIHHQEATPVAISSTKSSDHAAVIGEIRKNILQVLDARNKQGVDFLEVWRAAQDMGGATAGNIRMAFTSLKHAEPALDKQMLIQSAQVYISELESAFSTELNKREAERARLAQQQEEARIANQQTILGLEEQIRTLQAKLEVSKKEGQSMQQLSEPGIDALDAKIRYGKDAMDAVVQDIRQVMDIIQQEIN
jgi:hypothetical protein